ncbi:hypothetical protein N8569_00735 [bacterium]|nr:hypothetical protein [bacterium]
MSVGHNSFDAEHVAHELSERGLEWADRHAAAQALEEAQKSVLSEVACDYRQSGTKSQTEAESLARANRKYRDFVVTMVEARRMANRARVRFDTYKTWIELMRTKAATERAQMQLR